jgi:lipopolysaccharide transport system ATP-binding protein
MRPVVVFDSVSKKFQKGESHDSLRDLVPSLGRKLLRRAPKTDNRDFWAVREVSFEVKPGEALGVIGANGAGKSTTLKLLNRILKPTEGHCAVSGRMGALIEVAAGFHPDLTGRENVYLQGAIMGMRRREIQLRFDEIVEFSGVSAFIDTPVKRYSSGMNARLGFSIAAHLQPDVLIIDEVLAVGDVSFQQKCFARMEAFVRQGAAVVMVSHNLTAISQLCPRTLMLKAGRTAAYGRSADVIAEYCRVENTAGDTPDAQVGLTVRTVIDAGSPVRVQVQLAYRQPVRGASIGIVVWDMAKNLYVYGVASDALGIPLVAGEPGTVATYEFEFNANLARGTYALEVNVFDPERQEHLARLAPAAQFTIAEQVTYGGIANLFLTGHRAEGSRRPLAEANDTAAPVYRLPLLAKDLS